MKRMIHILGVTVAATLSLASCNEVPSVEQPFGIFTVRASTVAETKTTNDGLHTLWKEGDAITVLYAAAGTDPATEFTNLKMTLSSGAGTSSAEFTASASLSGSYDFYAIYPYGEYYKIPGPGSTAYTYIGHKDAVTQSGYGSMAHLSDDRCPLYGVVLDADDEVIPVFSMKNLASVMELNIVSSCSDEFVLTKVEVEASEDIVGSYYIDLAGAVPAYTLSGEKYVNSTGTVNITDGTAVSNGSTVKVYLPVKPYTQAEGTPLHVTLSAITAGGAVTASVDVPASADAAKRTFKAGKIKIVNVPVSEFESVVPPAASTTIAELVAAAPDTQGATTTESFTVTEARVMAKNGSNVVIEDDTDIIVYYGSNSVAAGDVVTVTGNVKNYYYTPEVVNGSITKTGTFTPDYSSAAAFDLDAYKAIYTGNAVLPCELVTVSGTLSADVKTLTVSGASAVIAPYGVDSSYSGKTVTLVGYPIGVNGSGKINFVYVSIEAEPSFDVFVSPVSLSWGADETDTKTVTVTCEQDWEVSGAPAWATVTKVNAASFTVTPMVNTSEERSATLTVTNLTNPSCTATVSISQEAVSSGVKKFVKVTSDSELTDGDYLIVYETGSVSFDGSLESLDALKNNVPVSISGGEIAYSSSLFESTFHINPTEKTVKSRSGYYIYRNANSNGLDAKTEVNTISSIAIDANGDAVISAVSTTLRFNSDAGQMRFRFYKSGQKAVQLYKLSTVEASESPEISVSNAELSWGADETDTKTVIVTCEQDWEVSGAPAWATVTKVNAASFTVTPMVNTSEERSATLTVTNLTNPSYTATVSISQEAVSSGSVTTDILTASKFAATNTTYKDFSDVSAVSTALYAGNTAKTGNGNIQLRSSNSNSGIVTSSSGGRVSAIRITFASETTSARVIDIYGKTTSYASAENLYATSSSDKGSHLGSLSNEIGKVTTVSLTVSGDYQYVGIRSKSGAVYIEKIEIDWE